MSKVISVAIGGFGRSGYGIHANWLKNDPEKFKIVAVADQIAERRQDAVISFPVCAPRWSLTSNWEYSRLLAGRLLIT